MGFFNIVIFSCAGYDICQFWVSFDWLIYLLVSSYFLLIFMPGNFFYQMPDIVNFFLFDAGCFSVPKIFLSFFWVQANYLETV